MTKHNSKVANLWNTTVLILAVLVPFSLMAQQPTGKILGTVTDPAGAVVPGATVTVTNTATRVSSQTQTDKDGNFQVLALPIGNYQVAAEREGFAKSLAEARTLEINQSVRMDIKLKLGSRTETITVESRASGVETVNPTLGQSITVNSLVGLPLNVRNPYDLALLLPGVTEANPNSGSTQQSTVGAATALALSAPSPNPAPIPCTAASSSSCATISSMPTHISITETIFPRKS